MSHDKEAALDQALDLFWTKGYASTSLKDLERATGMHPGSLYAAFGSKAKLYCLSLERYAKRLSILRAELQAKAASPLDGLADFIAKAHPLSDADAPLPVCYLVKATLETSQGNQAIEGKLSDLLTQNDATFTAVFQQAVDAGDLPANSDAKKMARQLSADLAGLCFYALREEDSNVIKEMVTDLANRIRHPH
ncbi:TetR/AcrR family transcriptional regulator [uncultured Shimia sp.]|uniref:TetR/AcrR family transcriptional regulator n=1 Tax=uncultured Shimia sp. TaxID=573152 RepID=UPI00261DE8A1|nr:TetR/AcrR family transcriptional regulator [uncultured Shimia sp.]